MLSNVELEAKMEAKRFALSVEEVDIGAIYYCGYSGFTHVHDLVGDRPEFTGSNLLVLAINLIGLPLALCDYIRFISNVAKKP